MMIQIGSRTSFGIVTALVLGWAGVSLFGADAEHGVIWVHPGDSLQGALDQAASNTVCKVVRVTPGTYRPGARGQALIALDHRHDGITLEAAGPVTLTAANAAIADPTTPTFPTVVNHVIYLGDGISSNTIIRGFRITGGNRFATDVDPPGRVIEPHFDDLRRTEGIYGHLFFHTDGAGIKVFGRSYPTLDRLEVVDNEAQPCAGGISIEHRGYAQSRVTLRNCVFRGNRALVTGSAVDLLPGSAATIQNCLFVGNLSNTGNQYQSLKGNLNWTNIPTLVRSAVGYLPEHGSGAVTVFPGSMALLLSCTFTANRNGIDDHGGRSVLRGCIFWKNNAEGGARSGERYELDVIRGTRVDNCFIAGGIADLRGVVDPAHNLIGCPDPGFNGRYVPTHPAFAAAGYRPVDAHAPDPPALPGALGSNIDY